MDNKKGLADWPTRVLAAAMKHGISFSPGDECPWCNEICKDMSQYEDMGMGLFMKISHEMNCLNCGTQGHNGDWARPGHQGYTEISPSLSHDKGQLHLFVEDQLRPSQRELYESKFLSTETELPF